MEYNWGIKDLKEAKEKLKIILKKEKNKNTKNYIKSLIKRLNDYIAEEELSLHPSQEKISVPEEVAYDQTLANIEYDLSSCHEYYSLVSFFAHTTDAMQDKIEEIESILSQRLTPDDGYSKITGATITNEKALSLTSQFYNGFSPELSLVFQNAFAQRNSSIRFVDNVEEDCVANSTYIDIVKRYFISITKTDDLSKLYTFIHEYGHVISYILNPKSMYFSSEFAFDEVASLFPELVAQYENIGNYDKAQVAFESYVTFILYRNKAINLDAHRYFIKLWNDNNRNTDDTYMEKIKELEFDEETFTDAIETVIDDEGTYIISYMVALELLHIYKQDKQRALEIFERFLKTPYTESLRTYLESEFTIGSHLQEETEYLIDNFKKELKKSGEFHV